MNNPKDSEEESVELPKEGYSAAMTEAEFERMKNDQHIRVTDWTGMGPMSEFDVFVSFGVKRP